MMRSLFAGVSGLRNHQIKMDVIGNNIANINTVGFKSGRVTFEENLNQMLQGASRPRDGVGGTNPMQVGLGMSVGSIDTIFSQGNLETTGNITDLAIQGDAFFLLSDGVAEYYTRAGNFMVDGDGRLVSPSNGFVIQGMRANSNGEIMPGTAISDIILPFGQKAPARSTTEIDYSCNLDSNTIATAKSWAASWAKEAAVTGSGAPGSLTIDGTNDTLTIEIDDDMGSTIQRTLTLTAGTYSSVSDIVAEINTQIANDLRISGEVVAHVADNGGTDVVQIMTTDQGGTSTSLTLSGNACTNLNLSTSQVTGTDLTTELNTLPFVMNDLSDGDEFTISGINPDGTVVSATHTYAAGDTIQDLLDSINGAFSGTSATFDAGGNLVLTDSIRGESQSSITLSFEDNDSSGSVVNIPSFQIAEQGQDAGTHTASITVYDSKGDTHTVSMVFTNISTEDNPNVWSWETIIDDGDIVPSAGNKGTVRFNPDGSLGVFSVDDGQSLTFDPGNGTDVMTVSLDAGDQNAFNGITQLRSPTTTVAKHQDGYAMGNLQTISVDSTGTITGYFSNGVVQDLAQIALATFNNPSGLIRTADSLYQSSANSGTPVKGAIGGGIQATINSGALEMSNVDLAHEFTNMIVAQRGFQANARVITTADNLLNEIVQLKR